MKKIATLLLALLLMACTTQDTAASPVSATSATSFLPTSSYKRETIQGFTILINPAVLAREEAARQLRNELDVQLKALGRVVPPRSMAALRKVRIWVEWEGRKDKAAEFHVSAAWLSENGYNPDKAGDVELANVRNFVAWSRTEQPWMVLHELSHAYHHRVLANTHDGIASAYAHAVDKGLYSSVQHIDGTRREAYAASNAEEYFAELSEAYFGKNDYYPFTRAELETHDPVGFRLMESAWGR